MGGTELELKFDAELDAELPSFSDLASSAVRQVVLTSTYWDTADRRIMALGCSLRFRSASDGSVRGWTLKVPAARSERGVVARHEVTREGGPEQPPAELLAIVRTGLLGEAPSVAATITTHRTLIRLDRSGEEAPVELADDRVESEVGGAPGPSFREIEAELVGAGTLTLLDEVGSRLGAAGFRPATVGSKVQRVLGKHPSLIEAPKRLRGAASVREFLVATIGASTRQLLINDPGVRLGADAEAVHQARVATRRLRSDLKTFGPMLSGDAVDRMRDELAWLGELLGNVRDPQVLEQRLTAQAAVFDEVAGADEDAIADLTDLLAERARFHHSQLVNAMDGDRYSALVADLLAMTNEPPVASAKLASKTAAPIAEQLARKQWKRAARFAAGLGSSADDLQLHDLRKRLKRARYAAQSVKRLRLGNRYFRRELTDLQDRLGDHHDLVVQREFLSTGFERLAPDAAFVAGRLLQDADHRRLAMVTEWPDLADRLERLDFD